MTMLASTTISKASAFAGFGTSAMIAAATNDPVALAFATKLAEGSVLVLILYFFFRYHERQMDIKQKESDQHFELTKTVSVNVAKFSDNIAVLTAEQKETNKNIERVIDRLDEVKNNLL